MSNEKFVAAVTRETILKLLSDEENAKLSTLEDGKSLTPDEQYVDLEHPERGVQTAGSGGNIGSLLPRQAVHEETWQKIVAMIQDHGK
jgi:hypothetical protein